MSGRGTQRTEIPGAGTFPAGPSYDKTFTFEKLTYMAAVDHRFDDDTPGHVSYSRGYKSGIFNTLPFANDPSKPEVVDTSEIGMKTDLLDQRLRLNAAVFINDIKHPQVQTIIVDGDTAFIGFTNAESAKFKGAEFSAEALLADGLRFTLSGAYLGAKYTGLAEAPFLYPPTGLPQNGGMCPIVQRDASGNRMAQVPKWRFNAGLNYQLDTSVGNFGFDANASYTGSFYWQPSNILEEDAHTLLIGSISCSPRGQQHWTFKLWGNNLTAEEYCWSAGRCRVRRKPRHRRVAQDLWRGNSLQRVVNAAVDEDRARIVGICSDRSAHREGRMAAARTPLTLR